MAPNEGNATAAGAATGGRTSGGAAASGAWVATKGGNAEGEVTATLTAGIVAVWTSTGLDACGGEGWAAKGGPPTCVSCPPNAREVVDCELCTAKVR